MNKNDKLQNSFKKAFEDHQEPLHEAQWERLGKALDEKPLKKKWQWFYLIGVFCLAALSFMMGYYLRSEKENKLSDVPAQAAPASDNTAPTPENTATAPGTSSDNTAPTQTPANTKTNENNTATEQVNNTNNTNTNGGVKPAQSVRSNNNTSNAGNIAVSTDNNKGNPATNKEGNNSVPRENIQTNEPGNKSADNASISSKDKVTDPQNTEDKSDVVIDSKSKDNNDVPKKDNDINTPADAKDTPVTKPGAIVKSEPTDSIKGGKKKDKDENGNPVRKKFAFTLSSGVSAVKTGIVSFSNPGNMHKDTRQLFDQSNADKSSLFVNMGFEWYPFKHLSLIFNSGLQYREFSTHENIEYKYNEVPFRYPDYSIGFYIHKADSTDPIIFKSNNVQKFSYVNLPLRLGYNFTLAPKHEMGLTLGVNISMIAGAKGNTFSLNDLEERSLKSMIGKKVNIGPIGGLNYTYNIYRSFWMGAELQWQRNNTVFETQYGSYKARYGVNNYNLIFRYKF